jgi:hypothetical protein
MELTNGDKENLRQGKALGKHLVIAVVGMVISVIASTVAAYSAVVTVKHHGNVSSWGYEIIGITFIGLIFGIIVFPVVYIIAQIIRSIKSKQGNSAYFIMSILITTITSFLISLILS